MFVFGIVQFSYSNSACRRGVGYRHRLRVKNCQRIRWSPTKRNNCLRKINSIRIQELKKCAGGNTNNPQNNCRQNALRIYSARRSGCMRKRGKARSNCLIATKSMYQTQIQKCSGGITNNSGIYQERCRQNAIKMNKIRRAACMKRQRSGRSNCLRMVEGAYQNSLRRCSGSTTQLSKSCQGIALKNYTNRRTTCSKRSGFAQKSCLSSASRIYQSDLKRCSKSNNNSNKCAVRLRASYAKSLNSCNRMKGRMKYKCQKMARRSYSNRMKRCKSR